jgi:hypothetical protein
MNDKDMLTLKKIRYAELLNQVHLLDEDLQLLHKKETNHNGTDLVGYICKVNNLEKMICMQKFRNCKNRCEEGEKDKLKFHCQDCEVAYE